MPRPDDLCQCGHQRAAHDTERCDKPCRLCACPGFARSTHQPNEHSPTTGKRLKKRGHRLGDKPGNLLWRGPGSN